MHRGMMDNYFCVLAKNALTLLPKSLKPPNMKNKFIYLFALSALPFTAYPQNANSSEISATPVPVIITDTKTNPNGRPQLPSRQHVECVYADGTLHFDFVIPEGEALLTVTDGLTGISAQYVFDTDAHAEVTIGYLSAASLEIRTDAGNTYTGTIQ